MGIHRDLTEAVKTLSTLHSGSQGISVVTEDSSTQREDGPSFGEEEYR